ncbi:Hypothetical protein D9617_16g014580 [Elsinoe fawcettii]|nr:Hypothetical protein D9617_16g014580 [Elsinoe fawcettii]
MSGALQTLDLTINKTEKTDWNDILSSSGLVSPPPSATEHRRQSTASIFQQWDDDLAAYSSGAVSPDHLHEPFTPAHDHNTFSLLSDKLSNPFHEQLHATYADNAQSHGMLSPTSPHEETGRFDFLIGHESQPQWSHAAKRITNFRPAPLLPAPHDFMMQSQHDTPPNTASTSFDSGIEMMTPISPAFMTTGQRAPASLRLDPSTDFCPSLLPSPPVVPSQTVSGSTCMTLPQLYRSDSGLSTSTLADFDASTYPSSVKAEHVSSPMIEDFSAPFPHYPTPTRVDKKKGKGAKQINNNIVELRRDGKAFIKGKQGLIPLDYKIGQGYSNPIKNDKPFKFCKEVVDGKECGLRFQRTEHLNRHMSMHTGARPHGCPVIKEDKDGIPGPCNCASRQDNSYDHISKHVSSWYKQFPEHKTKGSPRTKPFVSPEEMQETIIAWRGLDDAKSILKGLDRRIKKDVPGLDKDRHIFPMLGDFVDSPQYED